MKKLLLIPLLLLAFIVKAQLPVTRGPDGVTVEDYRLYILKNFRIPVFADTTEANTQKGLDSLGTIFNKRGTKWVFIRVPSTGSFHKWDTLGGVSSGGGGGSGDTVFLYQIGTAAGQIETLYAVDGNLRKSRWVPGYGTLPALAPDSAALINIDTTSIAYKSWVIQQFGTAVNNLQQVITNGNILTKVDTVVTNGFGLRVIGKSSALTMRVVDTASSGSISVVNMGAGEIPFSVQKFANTPTEVSDIFEISRNNNAGLARLGSGAAIYWYLPSASIVGSRTQAMTETVDLTDTTLAGWTPEYKLNLTNAVGASDQLKLSGNGAFQLSGYASLATVNDTTTYKPMAMDASGNVKKMDGWSGSGGGGSSNGIGRDTVQTYTSGTTLTQSASTNYIQVNPASVQATLTITTLASGGTWHTSNDLYIVFGGTVTSGNPVITSFTLTAGSGLIIVESAAFAGQANAGDVAHYHKIGTILYRVP